MFLHLKLASPCTGGVCVTSWSACGILGGCGVRNKWCGVRKKCVEAGVIVKGPICVVLPYLTRVFAGFLSY